MCGIYCCSMRTKNVIYESNQMSAATTNVYLHEKHCLFFSFISEAHLHFPEHFVCGDAHSLSTEHGEPKLNPKHREYFITYLYCGILWTYAEIKIWIM